MQIALKWIGGSALILGLLGCSSAGSERTNPQGHPTGGGGNGNGGNGASGNGNGGNGNGGLEVPEAGTTPDPQQGTGGVITLPPPEPTGGSGGLIDSPDSGLAPNMRGSSSASFDGQTITASITVRQVLPSDEQHVCVVVELPTEERVWVDNLHAELLGGSHHLIVDRRPISDSVQPIPEVCFPTTASDATRLMIAQQRETDIHLPEGVAFPIEARQRLFLQLHYLNATSSALDITGTLEMRLTERSEPIEAKSFFTGSTSIALQPLSPGSTESIHVPFPAAGAARHVFALTSHTHKLGVHSTIGRVTANGAPIGDLLHESFDWSEPPLDYLSPPLAFTGNEGLHLVCNYENTTSQFVGFGTETSGEMCFMWVYYYDQ